MMLDAPGYAMYVSPAYFGKGTSISNISFSPRILFFQIRIETLEALRHGLIQDIDTFISELDTRISAKTL